MKIKRTPLSIKPPEILIEDKYLVNIKDADVERCITYVNDSEEPIPVVLSAIPSDYFISCEDFTVKINGEVKNNLLKENYSDYSKRFIVDYDTELPPGKKLEITIGFKWKNFATIIDDLPLNFTFPDTAKYKLRLVGLSLQSRPYIFQIGDKRAAESTDYFVATNSIIFNEIEVNRNNPVRIKLLMLSTAKTLPVLHYFTSRGDVDFSKYVIILIQHMLSDFVHLVNSFSENSVNKSHVFIVGIPYSTKDSTVKYLKLDGYSNLQIPRTYPFEDHVKSVIAEAIHVSEDTGKRILIVEDGGYAVPLLHREFLDKADHFVGAVEQTTNGIWRDRDIYDKDGIEYRVPIIDVAESEIKSRLESPLIGRAVCRNIERLLGKEFLDISGKEVGLVGFGNTGSRIAKTFQDMGAKVTIFSNKQIDLNSARAEGYKIAKNARELIQNCKIIIEATGHEWAGREEINAFQNGSYFVSASSKRMGVNYNELSRLIEKSNSVNLPGIGIKYQLTTGNSVTFLADGYPVNFFDSESVADKAIEFILALLFESALFLVVNDGVLPNGIIEFKVDNDAEPRLKKAQEELVSIENKIAEVNLEY